MSRTRAAMLVLASAVALFGIAPPAVVPTTHAQARQGRVLAVLGRQVAFLSFDAPRPHVVTALQAPSFAMDVTAVASSNIAIASVVEPFAGQGDLGGDLVAIDLEAAEQSATPFVQRADAGEWLGAPVWLPDASAVLFQREDLRAGSDLYAGQAGARYPSRIEMVSASGGERAVLVGDGHHPSPAPDGSEIAFVRTSPRGQMLLARDSASGEERTLVAPGLLPDIAYPRYSPTGDRVAFVATTASSWAPQPAADWRSALVTSRQPLGWLSQQVAYAHGLPWDLWVVQRDGTGLRELAAVGADDASVAWSPDGAQIFVYGSTGARIVDAASGDIELLPYLAGFGAISWLP